MSLNRQYTSSALSGTSILGLLLSATLIVTGLFYPMIWHYQQVTHIESLLLADDFTAAKQALAKTLSSQRDARACYLKAVLERRMGNAAGYVQWRDLSRDAGMPEDALVLQDEFLSVQEGNVNREKEAQLIAQAQTLNSDVIAAQTYEAIGQGYLVTYRLKEAWQCLEFWIGWRPTSATAHMMRGEILIRTGMPALAVKEFREVLSFAPGHVAASEHLANTLLKLNEVEEATKLLEQTCQLPHASSGARIDLAEAQRRTGDLEKSAESTELALKFGVDARQRGQCCSILGQLALAEQQPQKAVDMLLAATELIPEDATTHHALGSALSLSGQSELGNRHRAIAQRIRENYEQVQAWTRQVIDNPNDPQLRVNIGQALLEQGLRSEGIAWIKTALVCDAQFEPAKSLLAKLTPTDASTPTP